MVDEQTRGLNLVSLVGDACELAHQGSNCQTGPIFLAVELMASGAEQLICAKGPPAVECAEVSGALGRE